MADQWYYQLFGTEFGPVQFDDVVRMLGSGELGTDDMVRQGADGSWVSVNSVAAFAGSATAVALQSSEFADDIDSFMLVDEKSSKPGDAATHDTVADDAAFDIDSFRIVEERKTDPPPTRKPQPAPEPVRAEPVSDLAADLDNFELVEEKKAKPAAQKKALPARPKGPAEKLDDPNAAVWYFQGLDQELGPVPLSEIRAMVESRDLGERDVIRKGRKGQWVAIETVEELFAEPPAPAGVPAPEPVAQEYYAPQAQPAAQAYSPPPNYTPVYTPAPPPPSPIPASMLLDVNWYCFISDQEIGPMNLVDMQKAVAQGQLTPETYVKYKAEGEWGAASQVPQLFVEEAPPPPPPAPVTPASLAPSLAAAIGPQGSNVADAERTELVQQLLTLLQQGMPAGSMSGSQIMAPKSGAGWFCNISGNVMGPVAIESLVKMVLQKRLFPDDLIRLGTDGEWFPAKTVPDLFPASAGAGRAKRSGLDDGENVMERIDKMYRESQEQQAKAAAARPASQVASPASSSTGSAPSRSNPAGDVLKNMSSNIARGAPAGSKSSGGSSSSFSLSDIKLDGKAFGILAALAIIAAGFYFGPGILAGSAAKSSYTKLVGMQTKVKEAEKSKTAPSEWATQSKDMLKDVDAITKALKGSKTNTPQRDVSKMAKYLKEMIEAVGKGPAPGAVAGTPSDYDRAQKFFEESKRAAAKKLRVK